MCFSLLMLTLVGEDLTKGRYKAVMSQIPNIKRLTPDKQKGF